MGIDRHELEHRNWRSSASTSGKEIRREIDEQLDTSIVPSDNLGVEIPDVPKVRVKREKTNQLR